MNLKANDNSTWADSLDDFKPEFTPIKCTNLVMCYRLSGRKTTLALENFEPIADLKYCYYSPAEKRYYFKTYPNDIPLWLIMFYDPNGSWDSYDVITNDLRKRVQDGNMYLLLTKEEIEDTTAMLIRLYKSYFKSEGKLPYKTYINLVIQSLTLEDYQGYAKNHTGFKTACKMMNEKIDALWNSARKN